MIQRYRVEVRGILPAGLRAELRHRYGHFPITTRAGRTVLADLPLDQAGLRALLEQLFDAPSDLCLVTTMDDERTEERR